MCNNCPWANAETCRACKFYHKQSDGEKSPVMRQRRSQAPPQYQASGTPHKAEPAGMKGDNMFFKNYIASRLPVEYVEGNCEKIVVDGKTYTILDSAEPEYMDDGIVNISFFNLQDEDGEIVENMFWAFDKIEDVEDPCEWSDEYDADNPFIIIFK